LNYYCNFYYFRGKYPVCYESTKKSIIRCSIKFS